MKVRFRMPEEDLNTLKEISLFKKEKRIRYINMIKSILPEYTEKNIEKLDEYEEKDVKEFLKFLGFSIKLFINFYNSGMSKDIFIKDIITNSIISYGMDIEIDDETRNFIKDLLKLDKSIGIFAKNTYLTYENLNMFFNGRIITDLRYLFYNDIFQFPDYAIIQHTLKLTYTKHRELKEKFFTLNLKQLNELKELVERAITKETTIKKLAKQNNLKILKEMEMIDLIAE